MSILLPTDFSNGRYKIAQNPKQTAALQFAIDYVEDYYLPRLFGVELNTLFLADFSGGVPTSPRFLVIYEAFTVQDGDCIVSSEGIKDMLKGLVYQRYMRDTNTRPTPVGAMRAVAENSETADYDELGLNSRYNEGVESTRAIQWFMCSYMPDDYPEYNGVDIPFNHPF
jgi:hypothetical protein